MYFCLAPALSVAYYMMITIDILFVSIMVWYCLFYYECVKAFTFLTTTFLNPTSTKSLCLIDRALTNSSSQALVSFPVMGLYV